MTSVLSLVFFCVGSLSALVHDEEHLAIRFGRIRSRSSQSTWRVNYRGLISGHSLVACNSVIMASHIVTCHNMCMYVSRELWDKLPFQPYIANYYTRQASRRSDVLCTSGWWSRIPTANVWRIYCFFFDSIALLFLLDVDEPDKEYSKVPKNTIPAPMPKFLSHAFPNHHTLMHKLSAFRVVNTRLVVTEDTFYRIRIPKSVSWGGHTVEGFKLSTLTADNLLTDEVHNHWVITLRMRTRYE